VHRLVLVLLIVVTGRGDVHAESQAGPQPAAGTLRGRVHVAQPAAAQVRRPDLVDPPPHTHASPQRQQAVVYLEVAPQAAFEDRPPGRARLDQRNETFVPTVLAIRAGTVVDFPNNDTTYHNVFSLSKARRFDLGRYAAGRSRAVRFDRPGIVRVFCDIHSHMNAFILVFSHPYFAVAADGQFDLGRVPAGTYDMAVWYDGAVRAVRLVEVRAGEETLVEVALP
jgi:plastocyanin